jgi:hypothetical protein
LWLPERELKNAPDLLSRYKKLHHL